MLTNYVHIKGHPMKLVHCQGPVIHIHSMWLDLVSPVPARSDGGISKEQNEEHFEKLFFTVLLSGISNLSVEFMRGLIYRLCMCNDPVFSITLVLNKLQTSLGRLGCAGTNRASLSDRT